MKGSTHTAIGVATSIAIAKTINLPLNNIEVLLSVIATGTIGGLLPDIDHANSKLGSKIPILPHLMRHRGFTHSIYFVILIYFLTTLINQDIYLQKLSLCFIFSIISHLFADMLTPAGLKIFKIGNLFNTCFRFPITHIPFVENLIAILSYIFIYISAKG